MATLAAASQLLLLHPTGAELTDVAGYGGLCGVQNVRLRASGLAADLMLVGRGYGVHRPDTPALKLLVDDESGTVPRL